MQSIPFFSLAPQHELIRTELENSFRNVVSGGSFILGKEVEEFERAYARYSGVAHCIAVGNGMDALVVSLKVLGIGPGSEVLVPSFTCTPTWMAVWVTGATPVAVEVDQLTGLLDASNLKQSITHKTRAIIPVNLFGQPASLETICAIGQQHDLAVVEDNAQGHGATRHGKKTGSFGLINATSFYPTKNLGALGDGGAITTNDASLAMLARQFRNYGSDRRFHHVVPGINSRLDELQASVLRVKLRYLDQWNQERLRYAAQYSSLLAGAGDLVLPVTEPGIVPNHHLYVVRSKYRDPLQEYLTSRGIGTDVHYPIPPHLQPAFGSCNFRIGQFPVSEEWAHTVLSLPLWPGLGADRVENVCREIHSFFLKGIH